MSQYTYGQVRGVIANMRVDGQAKELPLVVDMLRAYAATLRQPATRVDEATILDVAAELRALNEHWLADKLEAALSAQPAPERQGVIRHVGDSLFESWFSEYDPSNVGLKQVARDSYAAGIAEQAERLSAHPAAPVGVPDGMVLVPREPTEAMLEAFFEGEMSLGHDGYVVPSSCWAAMLAAARPRRRVQRSASDGSVFRVGGVGRDCCSWRRYLHRRMATPQHHSTEGAQVMAMTLEMVVAQILACAEGRSLSPMRSELAAWADAITAHRTQPAQAVDVGALAGREVSVDVSIGEHDAHHRVFGRLTGDTANGVLLAEMMQDTRALAGEQAGWRDALKLGREAWECYLVSGGGDPVAHAKFIATVKDFLKRANDLLPASPTPDKETQR